MDMFGVTSFHTGMHQAECAAFYHKWHNPRHIFEILLSQPEALLAPIFTLLLPSYPLSPSHHLPLFLSAVPLFTMPAYTLTTSDRKVLGNYRIPYLEAPKAKKNRIRVKAVKELLRHHTEVRLGSDKVKLKRVSSYVNHGWTTC